MECCNSLRKVRLPTPDICAMSIALRLTNSCGSKRRRMNRSHFFTSSKAGPAQGGQFPHGTSDGCSVASAEATRVPTQGRHTGGSDLLEGILRHFFTVIGRVRQQVRSFT